MGTDSQTKRPAIPDLDIVAATLRLADRAEAERDAQRPAGWPMYRVDDPDDVSRRTPAQDALLDHLRHQPYQTVAALYALFRTADLDDSDRTEAMDRFRAAYELAMLPMHRVHGAADLAAKAPRAAGLRRGLALLGLTIQPAPPGPAA